MKLKWLFSKILKIYWCGFNCMVNHLQVFQYESLSINYPNPQTSFIYNTIVCQSNVVNIDASSIRCWRNCNNYQSITVCYWTRSSISIHIQVCNISHYCSSCFCSATIKYSKNHCRNTRQEVGESHVMHIFNKHTAWSDQHDLFRFVLEFKSCQHRWKHI